MSNFFISLCVNSTATTVAIEFERYRLNFPDIARLTSRFRRDFTSVWLDWHSRDRDNCKCCRLTFCVR